MDLSIRGGGAILILLDSTTRGRCDRILTIQVLPGLMVLVEALVSFPLQELLYILAGILKNLGASPPRLTRENRN